MAAVAQVDVVSVNKRDSLKPQLDPDVRPRPARRNTHTFLIACRQRGLGCVFVF